MAYFYPGPTSAGDQRAHSEIIPSLPNDDLDLISSPAAATEIPSMLPNGGGGGGDGLSSLSDNNNNTDEDLFSMFLDVDKLSSLCGPSLEAEGESSSAAAAAAAGDGGGGVTVGADELMAGYAPWLGHQQHGQYMGMDEAMSSFMAEQQLVGAAAAAAAATTPEMVGMPPSQETISWPADLVQLALVDPVKARKILTNRQSAAKSKERKMRYIAELEHSVQALESEATALSVRLAVLQRDGTLLTTEHNELKIRLQAMDQHIHLQDALSNILQEEIQRLNKVVTGEVDNAGGGMMMDFGAMPCPFGGDQEMLPNNEEIQAMMATQQLLQLQPSLPASSEAATGPSEPAEATAPAAGTTAAGGGEGPQDEGTSDWDESLMM